MEKLVQNVKENFEAQKTFSYSFVLILLYLFMEYGRPQTYITVLRYLRPGMIIIVLLLIALFREIQLFRVINLHTKLFIVLIIVFTIHVPIASNNFHAFNQWRGMIILFIVYLGIVSFVDSYDKIVIYIDTWIIINVFGALEGIKNGGRIYNAYFMSDENEFALVMNMAIPFAYFMFMETDSKKKKFFYLLSIGVFLVGTVISMSRGGFIGLVAVLFYCWLKTPRKIFSTVMAFVMVLILLLAAPSSYWDEVKSIQQENISSGTGATRWYYWETAMKMYYANPIIGVGQSNFPWNVEKYGGAGFAGRTHGGRVAHSLYFTIISELGTVGVIIFLMMLFHFRKKIKIIIMSSKYFQMQDNDSDEWLLFVHQVNKLKFVSFAVAGSMIGYLVSGIFISVFYYPHFWILCALPIVLQNILNDLMAPFEEQTE